ADARLLASPAKDSDSSFGKQIETAVGDGNSERGAQLSGTRKEAHRAAVGAFPGAQQHRLSVSFGPRHDVGAVVHPIDEEDVEVSAVAIHRGNPRRAASFPGMRRSI